MDIDTIMKAQKMLDEADVPTDDRYFYDVDGRLMHFKNGKCEEVMEGVDNAVDE